MIKDSIKLLQQRCGAYQVLSISTGHFLNYWPEPLLKFEQLFRSSPYEKKETANIIHRFHFKLKQG